VISIVVISKDEPALDATLADLAAERGRVAEPTEVVVVDASDGRLDHIRDAHPGVRWLPFRRPPGVRVSIPHQRNAGVAAAAGDVVVFTDAGCRPYPAWLERLLAPLAAGEDVVAGIATSPGGGGLYDTHAARVATAEYLTECPTINLAFRRSAFDAVGGFDEGFEYGSDIDFSWRLADAGFRIRCAPDAVVEHDWGTPGRQLRRGYRYGRARARLYRKHLRRLRTAPRSDPMVLVYPLFLLGLPIALRHRGYLALLLLPAWRNRAEGPVRVLADHLAFGLGVLRELGPRR
jgi:glycosyltransferase involved in cell wall biosynthesis